MKEFLCYEVLNTERKIQGVVTLYTILHLRPMLIKIQSLKYTEVQGDNLRGYQISFGWISKGDMLLVHYSYQHIRGISLP